MNCSCKALLDITSAPKAYHFTSLNRHDSGFGDIWRTGSEILYHPQSPDKVVAPNGRATPTVGSAKRLSECFSAQKLAECATTHEPLQPRSGQEFSIDLSIESQRPRSTTRSLSHRSTTPTTTTNSLPSSNTSSWQSSAMSDSKPLGTAALCSTGAENGRACTQVALALHPQREEGFLPFSSTLNPPPAFSLSLASRSHTPPTITPVSFPLRRQRTGSLNSVDQDVPETLGEGPYQFENFVPASCIDWTQPSTRQREYRKIDQSCRGLRGLWRRLTPRWCHGKGGHLNFFREGDKCDNGSVRRYRISIAGKGDKPNSRIRGEEARCETDTEACPSKKHRLRRYFSFSKEDKTTVQDSKVFSRRKGKGKKMPEKEPGR